MILLGVGRLAMVAAGRMAKPAPICASRYPIATRLGSGYGRRGGGEVPAELDFAQGAAPGCVMIPEYSNIHANQAKGAAISAFIPEVARIYVSIVQFRQSEIIPVGTNDGSLTQ